MVAYTLVRKDLNSKIWTWNLSRWLKTRRNSGVSSLWGESGKYWGRAPKILTEDLVGVKCKNPDRSWLIRMGAILTRGKAREVEMAEALQKLVRNLNSTMVTAVVYFLCGFCFITIKWRQLHLPHNVARKTKGDDVQTKVRWPSDQGAHPMVSSFSYLLIVLLSFSVSSSPVNSQIHFPRLWVAYVSPVWTVS